METNIMRPEEIVAGLFQKHDIDLSGAWDCFKGCMPIEFTDNDIYLACTVYVRQIPTTYEDWGWDCEFELYRVEVDSAWLDNNTEVDSDEVERLINYSL